MLEAIIISLLVFGGCAVSFYWGYRLGYGEAIAAAIREVKRSKNTTTEQTISSDAAKKINEAIDKLDKDIQNVFSDEPSGIIMRPSSEELAKMNEDKDIKESKEEMARVIREAEEPRV